MSSPRGALLLSMSFVVLLCLRVTAGGEERSFGPTLVPAMAVFESFLRGLRDADPRHCMESMVCRVGANVTKYGPFGANMVDYFGDPQQNVISKWVATTRTRLAGQNSARSLGQSLVNMPAGPGQITFLKNKTSYSIVGLQFQQNKTMLMSKNETKPRSMFTDLIAQAGQAGFQFPTVNLPKFTMPTFNFPQTTFTKPVITFVPVVMNITKPAFVWNITKPVFTFNKPIFNFTKPLMPKFNFSKPMFTFDKPFFNFSKPLFTFNKPNFTNLMPARTNLIVNMTKSASTMVNAKPSMFNNTKSLMVNVTKSGFIIFNANPSTFNRTKPGSTIVNAKPSMFNNTKSVTKPGFIILNVNPSTFNRTKPGSSIFNTKPLMFNKTKPGFIMFNAKPMMLNMSKPMLKPETNSTKPNFNQMFVGRPEGDDDKTIIFNDGNKEVVIDSQFDDDTLEDRQSLITALSMFNAAFNIGYQGGVAACVQAYPSCSMTMDDLVQFATVVFPPS